MKQYILTTLLAGFVVFGLTTSAQAATYARRSQLVMPLAKTTVNLFDGRFQGGASIVAADVNGDGVDEYIVGAGPGGGPMVQVISLQGKVLQSWFAYKSTMKGGVNVAAGDLDGDGRAEVVTAPQGDYAPSIIVFKDGHPVGSFLAFAAAYHEGVNISVLDGPDIEPLIVVGTRGLRANEVRTYWPDGTLVDSWLTNVARSADSGVSVAAGWSESWQEPIVVLGAGRGSAPRVAVYGIWSQRNLVTWFAFSRTMTNGLSVGYKDGVIAVAPQGLGEAVIRKFTVGGVFQGQVRVFEKSFRGGLNVTLASNGQQVDVAAVPTKVNPQQAAIGTKKVLIDLSDQTLTLVENNKTLSVRRISSGKWSTPTPVGTYKTRNKVSVAYSRPYKLYMEWWMAITPDGKYGVHALPFWRLRNGGKLYEGESHIGTPVSHGCIRQRVTEAKSLYNWAPVGTPVIISK